MAGEVEIHGMAVHAAPDILYGINRFADYHFCSKGKYCDICGYGVIWLRHGTGIGETAAAGTFAAAAVSGGLEDPEGFSFFIAFKGLFRRYFFFFRNSRADFFAGALRFL